MALSTTTFLLLMGAAIVMVGVAIWITFQREKKRRL